jgi:hypothetical protein
VKSHPVCQRPHLRPSRSDFKEVAVSKKLVNDRTLSEEPGLYVLLKFIYTSIFTFVLAKISRELLDH